MLRSHARIQAGRLRSWVPTLGRTGEPTKRDPLKSKGSTTNSTQTTLFHVGVRVANLEAAMAELGDRLGITQGVGRRRRPAGVDPADGAFTTPVRFTYSCQGPQQVELV